VNTIPLFEGGTEKNQENLSQDFNLQNQPLFDKFGKLQNSENVNKSKQSELSSECNKYQMLWLLYGLL
jgi:hypothetical protein